MVRAARPHRLILVRRLVFRLAAAVVGAGLLAAAAGGETDDRGRYVELLRRKQRAERLSALYKLEADLSAKRQAYVVLDLSDRKLYFKVRGRAFKAISLSGIDVERRSRPLDPMELAGRAYTLQLKEGKGVETEAIHLKTLTPDEAARAKGAKRIDADLGGAEQGEVVEGVAPPPRTAGTGMPPATQKMEGVAGGIIPPDPPPRYHMGFDGGLSIWVQADVPADPGARSYDALLALAKSIGRWLRPGGGEADEIRITLNLPLEKGRQIFRQTLPGQRLLIVP